MIRHSFTEDELRAAIEAHKPGWAVRAAGHARAVKEKSRVDEDDAIWSEVKRVFAKLQCFKCIYCEKALPQETLDGEVGVGAGAVEYDVEHFRPKNAVQRWPTKKVEKARRIGYAAKLAMGEPEGYVRLAFDTSNYALSCKTCNTGHKRDYFPIAGKTDRRLTTRAALDEAEAPLLMFLLGPDATEPEALLGWNGPVPFAKKRRGYGKLRAMVCIDLFSLDTRSDLLCGRSTLICLLWGLLEEHCNATGAAKKRAAKKLERVRAPRSQFAACGRAFAALYQADRDRAERLYKLSQEYAVSCDYAVFSSR